jgi:hypothetical protein
MIFLNEPEGSVEPHDEKDHRGFYPLPKDQGDGGRDYQDSDQGTADLGGEDPERRALPAARNLVRTLDRETPCRLRRGEAGWGDSNGHGSARRCA